MRTTSISITFILLLIAGCATKLPPVEATYDGTVLVRTSLTAKVNRTTGAVVGTLSQPKRLIPVAGAFIAVDAGPSFDARFGATDQEDVRALLAAELVRTGLIKEIIPPESTAPPDIVITLDFVKTELVRQNLFYVLDVDVSIQGGGKRLDRQYHIDVHEQDSTAERWHSTFTRNKIKAKKLILKNAIPDIEAFLSDKQ
jgi:hypothetical protein